MEDKSYVTMEAKVCPVCGKTFQTDSLLLDRGLKKRFDRETVTGFDLCEEHRKQHEEGFVHLVEVDESKSKLTNGKIKIEDAYRTGVIVSVKANVLDSLGFPEGTSKLPFIFIDHKMVELLEKVHDQAEDSAPEEFTE